jgi:hypothetical protein
MFESRPTQYGVPEWKERYGQQASDQKAQQQLLDAKKPKKKRGACFRKAASQVEEGYECLSAGDPGMARLCYLTAAREVLSFAGPDKDAIKFSMERLYEAISAAQNK